MSDESITPETPSAPPAIPPPWASLLEGPAPAHPQFLSRTPVVSVVINNDKTVSLTVFGIYRGPDAFLSIRYAERVQVVPGKWWYGLKIQPVSDWEDQGPISDGDVFTTGGSFPNLNTDSGCTIEWKITDANGVPLFLDGLNKCPAIRQASFSEFVQ